MHHSWPIGAGRLISKLIYSGSPKPVEWIGFSRRDLRGFPPAARRSAGESLRRVQFGLPPSDAKSMPTIGPGVAEIRVHAVAEYRVVYVAKYIEAVYVLHAFEKRSRRSRQSDIERARSRFRLVERSRQRS